MNVKEDIGSKRKGDKTTKWIIKMVFNTRYSDAYLYSLSVEWYTKTVTSIVKLLNEAVIFVSARPTDHIVLNEYLLFQTSEQGIKMIY